MAERLECWTCNPKDPSSNLTMATIQLLDLFHTDRNLSLKSSTTLVNSQLVCLRQAGNLNPVMLNLYVDLITSWKPVSVLHVNIINK